MRNRLFDQVPIAGTRHVVRFGAFVLLILGPPLAAEGADRKAIDFFESHVRPLLIEHCYECHSSQSGESSGGLQLDTAPALRSGGLRGPGVVPGKLDESWLIRAVRYDDADLQMPPEGKLADEEIATLERWVQLGAPDPRKPDPRTGDTAPSEDSEPPQDPAEHWAFSPPQRAAGPASAAAWAVKAETDEVSPTPDSAGPDSAGPEPLDDSRDLIDAIAAVSAAEAEVPGRAAPADRATLIRRLYFDLVGLPPSPDEIRRFVESDRPDAYPRLVDSLLSRPEFGERFGRYWLDVARYADTIGYAVGGKERRLTGSERFRDWTISAFNSDIPYDDMIRHQLAGDHTDPNNEAGHLDAMGFLTVGRRFLSSHDTTDDRIDVISRGLLGLTVACARCHDHKFDPIPTKDYYSLYGILRSSKIPEDGPSPLMMVDKEKPHDARVLVRGQRGSRGDVAPRRYLTALRESDASRFNEGSGRWELAQKIASDDNPLTPRVMVNRLWDHLIGKPLVDSPSDFGVRTEPPAIPEVLDDLAAEFADHWSIKRTVRRILLTRIYRQSAAADPATIQQDPDNRWLTRANRRRRDFESLRDSMLQTAGYLEHRLGGKPVEISEDQPVPRRTVYAMIDRQNLPSLFRTFDFANPNAHSPGRYFTTVPQQALFLMNNEQMFRLARRTADVVRRTVGGQPHAGDRQRSATPERMARAMFLRVLRREPTSGELASVIEFLDQPITPPEITFDPRSLWSYGTATLTGKRISDFTPLEVYQKNRWQADQEYPSSGPLSYASLGKNNGHPPPPSAGVVARRWTAPADGQIKISGSIGRGSDKGDGIIASIHAGQQQINQQQRQSGRQAYGPVTAKVQAGEPIDFVVAAGKTASYDGFSWDIQINLKTDSGQVIKADAAKDFSGPFDPESTEPLDRLEQLAQTLLMSNEFAFVD